MTRKRYVTSEAMQAGKNSDTADTMDSRTSAIGKRKRAAENISKEDSDSTVSSDSIDRNQAKRARNDDAAKADSSNSDKEVSSRDVFADKSLNVNSQADPSAPAISWNKGVQPALRTSFGKAAAMPKTTTPTPAPAQSTSSANESKEDTGKSGVTKRITRSAAASEKAESSKKTKKEKKKESKGPSKSISSQHTFGDDAQLSFKNNIIPYYGPASKSATSVKMVIRDIFIPTLLKQNIKQLEDLDETKLAAYCIEFVKKEHEFFHDPQLVEAGLKTIELQDFAGFCKNQIKKAKLSHEYLKHMKIKTKVAKREEKRAEKEAEKKAKAHLKENTHLAAEEEDGEIVEPVPAPDKNKPADPEAVDRSSVTAPMVAEKAEHVEASRDGFAEDSEMTSSEELQVSKYYPGISLDTSLCLVCRETGHTLNECPHLTCSHCSAYDLHFAYACPKNFLCTKCRERGHRASECPEKLAKKVAEGVVCDICASIRHVEEHCPYLWRDFKPDRLPSIKKIQSMILDCYSCGAVNQHNGNECGLRPNQQPYGGQTWSVENYNLYWEGGNLQPRSNGLPPRNGGMGMSIKGLAKQQPTYVEDSSDDGNFINPPVAKRPQQQKPKMSVRLEDRITGGPNLSLPQYSQQPMSRRDYQNAMDNAPRYNGPSAINYNPGQPRLSDFDDEFSYQDDRQNDRRDDYRQGGGGYRAAANGQGNGLPNRPAPRQNNQNQNQGSRPLGGGGRNGGGGGQNRGGGGRPGRGGRGGGRGGGGKPSRGKR